MRISTTQLFRQGLQGMQTQQSALARTQQQVAAGKNILSPADDPSGARQLLELDQGIALTRQYMRNADVATGRLQLEESTLAGAGELLQRVREIAIAAGNPSLLDSEREALATEVDERLGELLGLANTKDGADEYIFAGTATRSRPFALAPGGGFSYAGDQGQRRVQIAPGYEIAIGDSGSRTFLEIRNGNGTFATAADPANTGTGIIDDGLVTDAGAWVPDRYTVSFPDAASYEVRDGGGALVGGGAFTAGEGIAFNGVQVAVRGAPAAGDAFTVETSANQSLFDSVQSLATALRRPVTGVNSQAFLNNDLGRALGDLDQGLEHLLQVRAGVGARLNAIDTETTVNEGFELHLQELHSQIQDLDLAEALTRLTQQSTALEAAQASFVRIQNLSLFNYL